MRRVQRGDEGGARARAEMGGLGEQSEGVRRVERAASECTECRPGRAEREEGGESRIGLRQYDSWIWAWTSEIVVNTTLKVM